MNRKMWTYGWELRIDQVVESWTGGRDTNRKNLYDQYLEVERTSQQSVFGHTNVARCAVPHTLRMTTMRRTTTGRDRPKNNIKIGKAKSTCHQVTCDAEEFPLGFYAFGFHVFIYCFLFLFLLLFRIDIFHTLAGRWWLAHRHKVYKAVTHAANGKRQSV